MPAKSIAQQRIMAKALACKTGKSDYCPPKIQRIADSMSKSDLEEFAKTKHDGLPHRIREGVVYKIGNPNDTVFSMLKDWLTGKNINFIENKPDNEFEILNSYDLEKEDQLQLLNYINKIGLKKVWENLAAGPTTGQVSGSGISTLTNTLGMKAVNPPGPGKEGSGDNFDNAIGSITPKVKKKKFKNK